MNVKMRVGGVYRQRNGHIEEIVSRDGHFRYPWKGLSGNCYAETGRHYSAECDYSKHDLIEEIDPPSEIKDDKVSYVLFVEGKFITCSEYGRVTISGDGHTHGEATAVDMFYLLRDTTERLQSQLEEARSPWWRKVLEKLK